MGDPETEVVLPRLKTDLLDLLVSAASGHLAEVALRLDERFCTTVVVVAGGYPEAYEKGNPINGLEQVKDSVVFHAGTRCEGDTIVTNGGRVLAVSSFGRTLHEALQQSYENISRIDFKDLYFRRDIGRDLFEYHE